MYAQHFGFTAYPFGKELKSEELFDSRESQQAELRLKHWLELRGIGLFTGEVGSGKTTTCRKFVEGLHDGLYRICYVPLSTGSVMDAYKSIAWEMGLSTQRNRADCYRVIQAEVTRLCVEAKKTPVLLIDEAHLLRNDVLEDLRLLTNFELDSKNRLCLLLVGLPEIRRRLRMAIHESFEQRIILKHHLKGLGRDELSNYLTHHLRRVGCESPIFAPDAQEALYQASNGLPRRINRLAHYALIAALAEKTTMVNAAHIETSASEIER